MEKATYYRKWTDADGIERVETATFPSDGKWPATYAERGWSQVPPEDVELEEPEEPDEEAMVAATGGRRSSRSK